MSTCPRCRHPVLQTPTGEMLTPEPTDMGIWRPDGSKWTSRELRAAIAARHKVGHSLHICKPLVTSRKQDDQASLF